jgi:hypothetical protein
MKKHKSLIDNISPIAEQIKQLSSMAVLQYTPLVSDIISGRITAQTEIEHILDGMLDFCHDEQMLLLYKQVCRKLLATYPELVVTYINSYREMWDTEEIAVVEEKV